MEDSQARANKAWRRKNRERSNYLIKRSTAKSFIVKVGSDEDILELNKLFTARLAEIAAKNDDLDLEEEDKD